MSESPVSWWEIQVPDLERAKAFYGEVFGWTFQPFGENFAVVVAGGDMVGGLDGAAGESSPAGRHVRIYFGTDDLEDILARIEKAGGEVLQRRALIAEEYGWYATFTDPSGIKLGLTTSTPPR